MSEKDGKALGAKIRKFRESAGLSQTELGEKLGVSYQQVQKYERGVSRLSVANLLRLARALDRPIGAFLPAGAVVPGGAMAGAVAPAVGTPGGEASGGETPGDAGKGRRGQVPAEEAGIDSRGGNVSEPGPRYTPLAQDEKELLKAYRALGDESARKAILTILRCAARKA